jgi:hypothetical protein
MSINCFSKTERQRLAHPGATPPSRRQVKANAKHSSAGCAAPSLRYGAFGVTASRRRGYLPTRPNAIDERSCQGSRSERRRRLDLDSEHGDGKRRHRRTCCIYPAPEPKKHQTARLQHAFDAKRAFAARNGRRLSPNATANHGVSGASPGNSDMHICAYMHMLI